MIKTRVNDDKPLESLTIRVPAEVKNKWTKEAEALGMNRSDYVWHMLSPVSPTFLRKLLLVNFAFADADYMACRDNEDVRKKNQNVYEAFESLMVEYFGEDWFDPALKKDHLLEKLKEKIEASEILKVLGDTIDEDKRGIENHS